MSESKKKRPSLAFIIAIIAIVGLGASVIIPNARPPRLVSSRNACVASLMQLEGAKATWALEKDKKNSDMPTVADLIGPQAYILSMPECPGGGTYSLRSVGQKPTCTIPGHTL